MFIKNRFRKYPQLEVIVIVVNIGDNVNILRTNKRTAYI